MKKIIVILSVFLFLNTNYSNAMEYSQNDIQRYSTYYSNGIQFLNNNQYSSAINEFKKVLRFSPYDTTTQTSLANAYFARGQYYKQTTNELKKALTDYKSVVFYTKYWKDNSNSSLNQLANSAQKEINDIEKRLNISNAQSDILKNGKVLKAQGELAASGYEFQQLKNSSYKETAYKYLGNIYKNLNNLANAMDAYKTALDYNPKNAELHFLYGVMLDEANNFEASMEQYNLALQYGDKSPELLEILENKWTKKLVENPADAQSHINLGAIYQKQGNFDMARTQYQKAIALDPTDDTALLNLASLFNQQKDYINANLAYDKLLAKNPNNIEILNYKAQNYKKMSKLDDALKQYETILAFDPNNNEAKENIDNIILNNFSGAKLQNYLMTKAKNNPNNYEAQFNYALELHKNKNLDGAIEYYQKALNANPSKEESYINLAQIYIDKKDFNNATSICQKGLMILPNNKQLNQYLSEINEYSANNQYETATKLFENKNYKGALAEYLKIENKTKEVKLAIASCYWQMQDFNNANKYYLELLNVEPNNIELIESAAWAYYSVGDIENTKKMASKVISLNKNNENMKNLLNDIAQNEYAQNLNDAIALYEKTNYQEALNHFNKILSTKTDDEYALYYKGLCLDELKKPNDAIKQYRTLVQKHPEFASGYYSLAVDLDNAENYKEAVVNYEKFITLKNGEVDDLTKFATSRIKDLKDYLGKVGK